METIPERVARIQKEQHVSFKTAHRVAVAEAKLERRLKEKNDESS